MSRSTLESHARYAVAFIAMLTISVPGLAQKDAGAIVGTVKDPSGALVPNAQITVTDVERGTTFAVRTSQSGEFVASPLKIGRYTVTVEHPGFKKAVSTAMDLDVQQRIVTNFTLQVGQAVESVEVTSAAPLLETETSELGQVVDAKRVENLPLNGRNFAQLALLTAGTSPSEPGARDENSFGFSANGGRSLQNNFLLDGIDNNSNLPDLLNETNYVIQPSVEALQEFKVQTNAYSAEFGRGNGAIVNAAIISGTNSFHGGAWEFLRNENLDARNFFDDPTKGTPPYKQNQFGAKLGGPLWKNRTFFFVDYEGLRIRQAQTQSFLLPTLAERKGDFSQLIDYTTPAVDPNGNPAVDCNGRPTYSGEIFDTRRTLTKPGTATGLCGFPFGYDPVSGLPINIIPSTPSAPGGGFLDPLALRLAALYPQPNVLNNPAINFTTNPVRQETRNNFDVRIDHKFGEKDNSFYRFSYEDQPSLIPGPFPGFADGGGFFSGDEDNAYRSFAASETHVFRPELINEFRLGYNRIHSRRFQLNFNRNVSADLGFPGVPFGPDTGGLPQLTFSDAPQLGSPTFLPSLEVQNAYSISDNVTWVKGMHTFKFGGEMRREQFTIFQPADPRGTLDFANGFTDNPAAPSTGGSGFASFMAGLSDGGAINNLHNVDYRRPVCSFYSQDDWKITPRLTLNLGLRYELFTTVKEAHDEQGTFDLSHPNTPTIIVPKGQTMQLTPILASQIAISATGSRGLVPTDTNNFAPRLGLAYKLGERTVLRSGYGIFYGGEEDGPYSNPSAGFNPPFFVTQSFTNPCPASAANPTAGQVNCALPGINFLFQGFPANALVDPNTPTLYSVDPNLVTPYVQQWHLSIEREMGFDTVFEISYAGSKGNKLYTFFNGNQALPTPDPVAPTAPRRPVPLIDSGIDWFRSSGASSYNSLQLRAEKRFSHGLSFMAAYTWAHSIDNASNANLGAQNNDDFRDFRHPEREYGNSSFSVRHRAVFSYIYELPLGRGKRVAGGVGPGLDYLVGGWQLAGVATVSSGNWFTVTDGNGNFSNSDGGTEGNSQRPNQVGDPTGKPCVPGTFFNTCAFTDPQLGSFGNVGRNTLQGPGYVIWDTSLFKTLRLSDRFDLEFRSEFFNLLNHTNFLLSQSGPQESNNSTVLGTSQFGFLTAARAPRQIQFGLKLSF
ncbi:MAG: TonB-dependent receptor [Acidobacteria bacterium]|nr:TonB-dependent receptor [Acidobacteriota bacterium]